MQVTKAPVSEMYELNFRDLDIDPEMIIPKELIFDPEEFGEDFDWTYTGELFRHIINRLDLTFSGAKLYLNRSGTISEKFDDIKDKMNIHQKSPGTFDLLNDPIGLDFTARSDEINLKYFRQLYDESSYFDDIEKCNLSLEDIKEAALKKLPINSKLNLHFSKGLTFDYEDGCNYQLIEKASPEIRASLELAVKDLKVREISPINNEINIPWWPIETGMHKYLPSYHVQLPHYKPSRAIEAVREIIDAYIDHLRAKND